MITLEPGGFLTVYLSGGRILKIADDGKVPTVTIHKALNVRRDGGGLVQLRDDGHRLRALTREQVDVIELPE